MRGLCAIVPLAVAAQFLFSCTENPVQEYGEGLTGAVKQSQGVSVEANLDAARRSIAAFRASEGRCPAGLDELSSFMGAALAPEDYAYDPSTCEIRLR